MTGNKFLITTALILLMLASLVNGTAVVKANPIPWSASPNQEKPALTIQSPTNNSRYPSEVPLDFNVTAPNSWSAYYWPEYYVGEINSITVYLDSNLIINYSKYRIETYFDGNKTTQYIDALNIENHYYNVLNQTSEGNNVLNITVLSYTFAKGEPYDNTAIESGASVNGKPVYKYPNVISEIVNFIVEKGTVAKPTATTTSTAVPSTPEFHSWIIFPILVVIMIFCLISYRIRGKNRLNR